MRRRLRNKLRTRLARNLRWWLHHYAGCVMCSFTFDGEFSRAYHASAAAEEYLLRARNINPRPVRVPRRFWHVLGRFV
jgi:hypothetical protein